MVAQELAQEALYNFGLETWKLARKVSNQNRKKKKFGTPVEAFASTFPDILQIAKGNKIKEIVLFFCMHTFAYGYSYPGFSWEYVEAQCEMILESKPGDSCRNIFH